MPAFASYRINNSRSAANRQIILKTTLNRLAAKTGVEVENEFVVAGASNASEPRGERPATRDVQAVPYPLGHGACFAPTAVGGDGVASLNIKGVGTPVGPPVV